MSVLSSGATDARERQALAARVSVVVLEGLLWALLTVVLVTNVARPLAGDAMLGIGEGPYWGTTPSVTADVSDAVWERAFETLGDDLPAFGPGMMVGGPFERGEYVEATLPNRTDISVWSPMTFRQMVAVAGAPLLSGVVVAAALALAIRIVRDLRRGRLFDAANLRRTYQIAAVLGVGGMIAEVATAWGRIGVLTSPRLAGYVDVDWTVSFTPLVLGLTIAAGAEMLRLGIRMQRDVEGLV